MKKDLSVYQLKDYDEINKWCKTEPERYKAFIDKVYKLLNELPAGLQLSVTDTVEEKDYELFIKCVCLYILEKRATGNINDSYIEFRDEQYYVVGRKEGWVPPVHREMNTFYQNRK